jgi:nucleoside-diphosphate-sugar epimerase
MILVTGASGYVGSALVPELLSQGFSVCAVDTFWFGDHLKPHKNLIKIKQDIRNLNASDLPDIDIIIHLAAVANDPSADLDPNLSWEIGSLGTRNLCEIGKAKSIKLFILASSGSVYGIKSEPNVVEELDLVPISVYNKVKMVKERICLSYQRNYRVVIFRPATICGWSPRLRLDLAVNALTFGALKNREIIVYGGSQMRPQLHIDDMVKGYIWALGNDSLNGIYNIGFENDSILDIANKVKSLIKSDIKILGTNDPRSYKLDSSKLLETGFFPSKNTLQAILELKYRFENGFIVESEQNYNVNWMKTSKEVINFGFN